MRLLKPLSASQLHLHPPHKNYLHTLTTHHTAGVHLLFRPQSGVFSATCLHKTVCLSGLQDDLSLNS